MSEGTCNSCGWALDADARFCSNCGARVAAETEVESVVKRVQNASSSADIGLTKAVTEDVAPTARARTEHAADPETVVLKPLDATVGAESSPRPVECLRDEAMGVRGMPLDDGCDFVLDYDDAKVFLAGFRSGFRFRVRAKNMHAVHCRGMKIEVKFGFQSSIRERIGRVQPDRHREIPLTFKSNEVGYDIPAKVLLSYTKDGEQKRFVGHVFWDCFPQEEESRKIIENLTVRLENVSSDRAADQNIRILEGFKAKDPQSKARQLEQLKLMPVWRTVALDEYEERSQAGEALSTPPTVDVRLAALTLHHRDWRYHLMSGEKLVLGKNRQCDIVTRLFERDGSVTRERNGGISRYHCRLVMENGECFVQDGAFYPDLGREKESAQGTYVDGVRLSPMERFQLATNSRTKISLAGSDASDAHAFQFEGHLWTCDVVRNQSCSSFVTPCPPNAPSCLVLRRCDSVREAFVIVWRCCPLQLIDPSFGDTQICRKDNAFGFIQGNRSEWLSPGEGLLIGDERVRVAHLEQVGL